MDFPLPKTKKEVMALLFDKLSNNNEFENVTKINDSVLSVIYNGGYNNVYNYNCTITICDVDIINDEFYWWKFVVTSELHETDFRVDNYDGVVGFLEFFIDEHIKEVGCILNDDTFYDE